MVKRFGVCQCLRLCCRMKDWELDFFCKGIIATIVALLYIVFLILFGFSAHYALCTLLGYCFAIDKSVSLFVFLLMCVVTWYGYRKGIDEKSGTIIFTLYFTSLVVPGFVAAMIVLCSISLLITAVPISIFIVFGFIVNTIYPIKIEGSTYENYFVLGFFTSILIITIITIIYACIQAFIFGKRTWNKYREENDKISV